MGDNSPEGTITPYSESAKSVSARSWGEAISRIPKAMRDAAKSAIMSKVARDCGEAMRRYIEDKAKETMQSFIIEMIHQQLTRARAEIPDGRLTYMVLTPKLFERFFDELKERSAGLFNPVSLWKRGCFEFDGVEVRQGEADHTSFAEKGTIYANCRGLDKCMSFTVDPLMVHIPIHSRKEEKSFDELMNEVKQIAEVK